jgi:hypothetical protein
MRAIKHKDSNEKEIFEGDTIQFENNTVYLEDAIIDFLKIDKVTAYVVPMNGQVGVTLKYRFFSNDVEVYTSANKKQFLLQKEPTKKQEIQEWFDALNTDPNSPIETILSGKTESIPFAHQFVHKAKKIINSTLTDEEKELVVPSELFLRYDNDKTTPITQSFLIKLTEEAIERVLLVHGSLCDDSLGYEGKFTHLKLVPDIKQDGEHKFKCSPLDDDMKNTFYMIFDSFDKKKEVRKAVLRPIQKEIDEWKEENKNLDNETFERTLEQKMSIYKAKHKEIKETQYLDKKLEDSLFLGFAVSDNLLDYFLSTGSTITLIDNNQCKNSI